MTLYELRPGWRWCWSSGLHVCSSVISVPSCRAGEGGALLALAPENSPHLISTNKTIKQIVPYQLTVGQTFTEQRTFIWVKLEDIDLHQSLIIFGQKCHSVLCIYQSTNHQQVITFYTGLESCHWFLLMSWFQHLGIITIFDICEGSEKCIKHFFEVVSEILVTLLCFNALNEQL